MLTPTDNPAVYTLLLRDWDSRQPDVKTGVGTRSEIHCKVEYSQGGIVVEYVRTDYFQRETPVLPWRLSSSMVAQEQSFLTHIIRAQLLIELLQLIPVEVKWPASTPTY